MRSAAWPSHNSGTRPALAAGSQDFVDARATRARSRPTSVFVPCVDRDRPLGVLAHRQARHRQRRRLFLDAAGIGQHEPRIREQSEHFADSPAARAA